MSEQLEEDGFGMDYAMHRHDVERLEEVYYLIDVTEPFDNLLIGVNNRLLEGWVLLAIKQSGDWEGYSPVYIMGIPRPKFCSGWGYAVDCSPRHPRTPMTWHHESTLWTCKECDHKKAIREDNEKMLPVWADERGD